MPGLNPQNWLKIDDEIIKMHAKVITFNMLVNRLQSVLSFRLLLVHPVYTLMGDGRNCIPS